MCFRNKEGTEAGKLAYISFFEIRPIIFQLKKDAKLGKPMRAKQKITERLAMQVASAWKARGLESQREHEAACYPPPSKTEYGVPALNEASYLQSAGCLDRGVNPLLVQKGHKDSKRRRREDQRLLTLLWQFTDLTSL